jgi:hypothetical protein
MLAPAGKSSAPPSEEGSCGEICADLAHCLPKGTRFHDLRHFYASTLIAANLNPKVIQARLGHATITETMDTYGHLFPDAEDLGRGGYRHDVRSCPDGTGTEPEYALTAPSQVREIGGGEPACRPGSVRPLARGGGHPSGTAVADSLVRSTREHRAGRPQSLAQGTVVPLLTLLRVGFT